MTDIEAKALALVNEFRAKCAEPTLPVTMSHVWAYGAAWEALCRVIKREAAAEARHAAELRELKERFSVVAARMVARAEEECSSLWAGVTREILAPFILPAPDPLVEAWVEAWPETPAPLAHKHAAKYSAAMQARGYEWRKIGEAGE